MTIKRRLNTQEITGGCFASVDEYAATIRLLTSAPDLLASLVNLLWQWDNYGALMPLALQDARAAITKATEVKP